MAEEDSFIDVKHAIRVCRGQLAGRVFLYPRRLKLDHFITPETGSKYGNAVMEQIANNFISGNVNEVQAAQTKQAKYFEAVLRLFLKY